MSDTTTDTSVIDEKKAENDGSSSSNSQNYWSNLGKLISNIFFIIIFIIIYFAFGVYTLYICKISQSNILPTSADCFPFSDGKPQVTPIQTNIFKSVDKSIKLSFPYEENSDFTFLKILREYKNSYDSNSILNYFISIIETLISFDFKFINITFNTLNGLPEGLLVFFGPFILGIVSFILLLCNCFYGLFLWFFNMSWLFKKNTNIERGKNPVWEDVTLLQPINYGVSIFLVIIFSIILLFGCLFFIGIDHLISLFCLNIMFTYTGIMVNKSNGFSTVFTEALKVYKISLMVIVSILVVSSAFAYLGISGVISALLVLGAIIFGILNIDTFKPITDTNMTPFTVTKELQAKRDVCKMVDNNVNSGGALYNMVFGKGNQKGGQLVNELKKLSKNK
jgi:hypothetical protein